MITDPNLYSYTGSVSIVEEDISELWDREHTQEAIKKLGEVFTPTKLVNEMCNKLPIELFKDPTKTFLDNSCGNGQFLAEILRRKMKNGISHKEALKTIYGVELNDKNALECRRRLSLKINIESEEGKEIWKILENNIICADAMDPNHCGWNKVGFYWNPSKINKFIDY